MWDNGVINLDEAISRVLGHKDMYIRWLNEFFVPETLAQPKEAFGNKNHEQAHKAVHKMKGTAGNLAITALTNQAASLDEMIKNQTPFEEMAADFEKMISRFNEAELMFRENQECISEYDFKE